MASLPSSPLCYFMKGKEDAYLKLFQTLFRKRKKKEYIRQTHTNSFPLPSSDVLAIGCLGFFCFLCLTVVQPQRAVCQTIPHPPDWPTELLVKCKHKFLYLIFICLSLPIGYQGFFISFNFLLCLEIFNTSTLKPNNNTFHLFFKHLIIELLFFYQLFPLLSISA